MTEEEWLKEHICEECELPMWACDAIYYLRRTLEYVHQGEFELAASRWNHPDSEWPKP